MTPYPTHSEACLECRLNKYSRVFEPKTEVQQWARAHSLHAPAIEAEQDPGLSSSLRPRLLDQREQYALRFNGHVLTRRTIEEIAKTTDHAPILEIGAGNGYWSYELKNTGVDAVASDPGYRLMKPYAWTRVEQERAQESVPKHPERSLLMASFNPLELWRREALEMFTKSSQGKYFIYADMSRGERQGYEWLGETLEASFELKTRLEIPLVYGEESAELFIHQRG